MAEDWHLVKRNIYVFQPYRTMEVLLCEEVHPLSLWKIDISTVGGVHYRSHEERTSEVVLIIDMPASAVVWMVEEKCLQDWVSCYTAGRNS